MSYNYLPPLSNDANVNARLPQYHEPGEGTAGQLPPTSYQDNPESSSEGGLYPQLALRRSFSLPDSGPMHQDLADQQLLPGSQGDKKRNKLGYHRTSIACSHCRRRKIRCIPSTDAQSPCTNCIKLKKECSFNPVDQQAPADPRAKAPSRASSSLQGGSTSSSPAVSTGNLGDTALQQHFATMDMATPANIGVGQLHNLGGKELPTGFQVPLSGASLKQTYDFQDPSMASWSHVENSSDLMSRPGDAGLSRRNAHPIGSPASMQYSALTNAPPPGASWTNPLPGPDPRGQLAWDSFPPPVRSMSYSGEASDTSQAQYITANPGQSYQRRHSNIAELYPPSIGVPMAGMGMSSTPSTAPGNSLPMGTMSPEAQILWSQQSHQYQQSPYTKDGDDYMGPTYGNTGGFNPH